MRVIGSDLDFFKKRFGSRFSKKSFEMMNQNYFMEPFDKLTRFLRLEQEYGETMF